jgi:hypothetical protein
MILHVKESGDDDVLEFAMEIERDDNFQSTELYIGEPHKTYGACIHLSIYDDDDEAVLNGLQYGPKCSIVLKAGLIYLFRTYPSVQRVSLTDKAAVGAPTKMMLSAKRLLQGRKGWYEEHFGAIPNPESRSTMNVIKALKQPFAQNQIQFFLPITTQRTWGTAEEIIDYAYRIAKLDTNAILGTSWLIHRDHAATYERDIHVRVLDNAATSGGGSSPPSTLKAPRKRLLRAVNRKALALLRAYYTRYNALKE